MVFCPNTSAPHSVPAGTPQSQEAAPAQRVSQVQYIEERLRNCNSPVAVAVIAAMLAQLETQQVLPNMILSLVAEIADFQRTMTYQNGSWDGYDLTHPFLDDRSIVMYGPSQNTVFEQEASLRMLQAASGTPQPSQPPQRSAFQKRVPRPVPGTPVYSGSPAERRP